MSKSAKILAWVWLNSRIFLNPCFFYIFNSRAAEGGSRKHGSGIRAPLECSKRLETIINRKTCTLTPPNRHVCKKIPSISWKITTTAALSRCAAVGWLAALRGKTNGGGWSERIWDFLKWQFGVAICSAHWSRLLSMILMHAPKCMGRVSFDCKLSLKVTVNTPDLLKEKHGYMKTRLYKRW